MATNFKISSLSREPIRIGNTLLPPDGTPIVVDFEDARVRKSLLLHKGSWIVYQPPGNIQLIGPISLNYLDVVETWDIDHADLDLGLELTAGAFVWDIIYRVTVGFDTQDNSSPSLTYYVGEPNSEEFFSFNFNNANDPLVGMTEQETGTLIGNALGASGGGTGISPRSLLYIASGDNAGGMPAYIKQTTILHVRYGFIGSTIGQPSQGNALIYVLLVTPTVP